MNPIYYREGELPNPSLRDTEWSPFLSKRDHRTPRDFARKPPRWWARPWRKPTLKRDVLDQMLRQFYFVQRDANYAVDNKLIILMELTSPREFNEIFNPDWSRVDGIVYNFKDAFLAVADSLAKRTQVL